MISSGQEKRSKTRDMNICLNIKPKMLLSHSAVYLKLMLIKLRNNVINPLLIIYINAQLVSISGGDVEGP